MKHKKAKPTRKRGSLTLIALFLLSSAALRIAIGADQATAKTDPKPLPDLAQNEPSNCSAPADIQTVLDALSKREERVEHRENALADRWQALSVAESVVEQQLSALIEAENDLQATIAQAEAASENDVGKLTAVYESMKPGEAAALFEEMDPDFAAGFLGRMQPGAAAGIMAGLQPSTAYTISVVLAGRNANVPKE